MRENAPFRGHVLTAGVVLLLLSCSWAVACKPQPARIAPGENREPHAVPAELRDDVERAQALGRLLFERDRWAWQATDAVLAAHDGQLDERSRGWVVTEDGGRGTVSFVGLDNEELIALYRVHFDARLAEPRIDPKVSPDSLTPEEIARFEARRTATASRFLVCSERYNAVVLSARHIGSAGWLVYLLPATTQAGIVLVGGYHRVHVSEDGSRVLSQTPFSKGCLALRTTAPNGAQVVELAVTHLVSDAPLEHHVFLSLSHMLPISVASQRGIWRVARGRIAYLGPLEAPPE